MNFTFKHSGENWLPPCFIRRPDGRLFQLFGKVGAFAADFAARLYCLAGGWLGIVGGMGFLAEKVISIRDADRVEAAAVQRPLAGTSTHPIEIVKLPVGGLEPSHKPSFTWEIEVSGASDTALTQITAESGCATEQDHHRGVDIAAVEETDGGRGGCRTDGRNDLPDGLDENEILGKGGSV